MKRLQVFRLWRPAVGSFESPAILLFAFFIERVGERSDGIARVQDEAFVDMIMVSHSRPQYMPRLRNAFA